MKILMVIPEKSGSSFYRIRPQARYLEKQGHDVLVKTYNKVDREYQWADIVIFENIFSSKLIKHCHKFGSKVIIETDDLVHNVPKTHYDYAELKGWRKYKWYFRVLYSIWKADGFIASNKQLKGVYGWVNKNTLVFPNYCDIEHWIRPHSPNQGETLRVLWAGSKSHKHDLLFIKPIIKKLLKKYSNIKFIYIGMGGTKSKDLYSKFVYGEDVFEGLPDNREMLLGVDPQIYPHILATLHADIAIAPLTKDKFNHFKTPCKYLEYSINKIPAVYSRWFYQDIVGNTGLLAETEEEWLEQISRLIDDKALREDLSEKSYQNVLSNHNIINYLNNWQGFIEKI